MIVSYRAPEHLARCLASVPGDHRHATIVVENGACPITARLLERKFPWADLIAPSENTGFGQGVHTALQRCTAPTTLVLNADTELGPDTMRVLEEHLRGHPGCALVGPRVVGDEGRLQPSCFPWPSPADYLLSEIGAFRALRALGLRSDRTLRLWDHRAERAVPWVLGCAFALRRSAYDDVGGFDPGFFMYFEEVDLCRRLESAGWGVEFTPAAEVRHTGSASTGQIRTAMRIQFHASMGRWYRLHRPDKLRRLRLAVLASLVPLTAKATVTARLGGRRGADARSDLAAWRHVARHWPPEPPGLPQLPEAA